MTSKPSGTLRPGTPDDARDLATIKVESWRAGYAGLLPDRVLALLDVDAQEERWRTILRESSPETNETWIYRSSDETLGYVGVGPDRADDTPPTTGEVLAIYVHPRCFRQGVGRQLLELGLNRLRDRGFEEAALWVLAGNERAIGFYRDAGFAPDGATREECVAGYESPHMRLRMALTQGLA